MKNVKFDFLMRHKKKIISGMVGFIMLFTFIGLAALSGNATESKPMVATTKTKGNTPKKKEKNKEGLTSKEIKEELKNESSKDMEISNNVDKDKKEVSSQKEVSTKKNESKSEEGLNKTNTESSQKETASKNEKHTHQWKEVHKEVDNGKWGKELVNEAWVEEVPVYKTKEVYICHGCGKDIRDIVIANGDEAYQHDYNHLLNGEASGWTSKTETVQIGVEEKYHEAEYKKVWIPKIENKFVGYSCSCGAKK